MNNKLKTICILPVIFELNYLSVYNYIYIYISLSVSLSLSLNLALSYAYIYIWTFIYIHIFFCSLNFIYIMAKDIYICMYACMYVSRDMCYIYIYILLQVY